MERSVFAWGAAGAVLVVGPCAPARLPPEHDGANDPRAAASPPRPQGPANASVASVLTPAPVPPPTVTAPQAATTPTLPAPSPAPPPPRPSPAPTGVSGPLCVLKGTSPVPKG